MKRCAHCKLIKDEEEFAWANQILKVRQKQCRDCMKEFNRASYERRSEEKKDRVRDNRKSRRESTQRLVWDYLRTHPCVQCGESDPIVLEFDHVTGNKHMNISDMIKIGYSAEAVFEEIQKCQVLCSNCHRRKTHKERGWFKG